MSTSVTAPPVLELREITKVFPIRSAIVRRVIRQVRAVDLVSLAVGRGETVGLVGESGSGKSTLGRLALRLIEPTSGRVLLDGRDITDASAADVRPLRRQFQMVFQDPYSSFDPRATIADSVGEPLRTHLGLRGREHDQRVGALLEMVRLSPSYLRRYPSEFSGGQLQRLALARALAIEPKLIVCDEPVSSLDVSTQAQVIHVLEELQERLGLSYVFISHDLSVVRHVSRRIAVMYLGQIVEEGPAERVCEAPRHPYTQALLSAVPVPDPDQQRRRSKIILTGDLPDPSRPPTGCRFHTRCPQAMDVCRTVEPPMFALEDGGHVICHLHTTGPTLAGAPVRQLDRPPN